MKTAAVIAGVLFSACTAVGPTQVEFDKVVGSAYGLDPCDCTIQGGTIHLLCSSDGDLDTVSFDRIPPTAGLDFSVELGLTTSNVTSGLVGTQPATGRIGALGASILSDPNSSFPIRQIGGMHIAWPQQDACSFQAGGCDNGRLPIHSGRMESGHGGCEDLGF